MEEVKEPEEEINNEEPTYEVVEEEKEVTKEGILSMYAHCNVVELDSEASQFLEGMVKAKNVGKDVLPYTFGGPLIMVFLILVHSLMLFLIEFISICKINLNMQIRRLGYDNNAC
jgi:hypothetical protein